MIHGEDNSHRSGSRCLPLINMLEEASIAVDRVGGSETADMSIFRGREFGTRCPLECV